tara:strand:- start:461 stop:706 length:246 start_codon:yes stop_codon:yes gene_type:complete
MPENSLLKQYYLDKAKGRLLPEINNCLEQILLGFVGRYQHLHQGSEYCCRSKLYCPVQTANGPGMKKCLGAELYAEFIKNS